MRNQGNKIFAGQSIYIGIDVHKKKWQVTIMGEEYEHKTFSQDPKVEILSRYLKKNFPGADYTAVYEAGFCGFGVCRKLREQGILCEVLHPADVPTSRKEKMQKTDKIDSRKLARSLRDRQLEFIHIPDPELESDRALVRQRNRMSKDLSRTKNRVKSLLLQFEIDIPKDFTTGQSRQWSKAYVNWLRKIQINQPSLRLTLDNYIRMGSMQKEQLLIINGQIRALSRTKRYKKSYELISAIPGIGLITGMTLLVQIGDINRFKSLDELCCYIGLIPSMHGSGDKMRAGRITSRGRKELKVRLIESAWVAIRLDPALMLKYNELKKRMNGNKAIIRIVRKLVSRIRHVLQTKQPYEIGIVD